MTPSTDRIIIYGILLGVFLFTGSGCSNPDRRPDGGRSRSYTLGAADFDMEAIETAPDGASGVELYLRILQRSLIFLKREAFYIAAFEVRVRFVADRDGSTQVDDLWGDSVRTESADGSQPFEETVIRRQYALAPGEYLAEVSLTDENTRVTATRRQSVHVFEIASGCAALTRIRLEYRTARGMTPFLPLHVRQNVDSLRALLTVYHPKNVRDGTVRATLLRYPTDSALAIPPYHIPPFFWSAGSRGVDLSKPCTLWTARKQVSGDEPSILSFDIGHLERGMHELAVDGLQDSCGRQEGGQILQQRRYLCIVNRDFPRLTTLGQLIEVLPYLARESEYRDFAAAPADPMRLFDKFWLGLGGNPENARNLMRNFYARAEEANLLFSTHKEGWKTDRGMIYIVFGPPSLIERQLSSEAWSYSSGSRFVFERVRTPWGSVPFENYILLRDPVYERAWTTEVDRWRRGRVF